MIVPAAKVNELDRIDDIRHVRFPCIAEEQGRQDEHDNQGHRTKGLLAHQSNQDYAGINPRGQVEHSSFGNDSTQNQVADEYENRKQDCQLPIQPDCAHADD